MSNDLKSSIDAADKEFGAAFNRGDFAALASLYMPDAAILPPGAPLASGRASIQEFWRQAAHQLRDLTLRATEVVPLGPDAAREIGAFTATAGETRVTGKYVVIWRREGEAWRLETDIWNTD